MTRIDAFTNLPGYWNGQYHSNAVRGKVKYKLWEGESNTVSNYGSQAYSECFKSPITSGITPSGWRRPTAYSRYVSRCTSLSSWKAVTEDHIARSEIFTDSAFAYLGVQFRGNPFFGVDGSISVSSDIVGRAQTEALAKISDRKISIGVALGESTKTVDWLATKAKQLYIACRHLRKGRFRDLYDLLMGIRNTKRKRKLPRKARSFVGAPSSWWLQYWYAFTPLVSDVYGIAVQVESGFREKDQLFSVTRTITQPLNPPYSPLSTSHIKDSLSCWESGHATESCRVKIWGRINTTTLTSLSQLGLLNPALIAWELVPFSFVVDWLVPIGSYLESLSATFGVTFHDGFQTLVTKGRYDASAGAPVPGTGMDGWTYVSPARGSFEFFAMSRQPYQDWPVSSLYAISPWSTKHVLSALALILQRR